VQNLSLIAEYTHTNPLVYKHFIPTESYQSDGYSMGSYLGDNAEEYYFALHYKLIRGLKLSLSYSFSQKGPNYPYTGVGNSMLGLPFINTVVWYNKSVSLALLYEVFNDISIFAGYSKSLIKDQLQIYEPNYFLGNTNTINVGMNWGF